MEPKTVPVINKFINEECYIYDFSINYIQFFYNYVIDYAEGEIVFEITPRKEKMEIKGTYNDPEYSFVEAYVEYDNISDSVMRSSCSPIPENDMIITEFVSRPGENLSCRWW